MPPSNVLTSRTKQSTPLLEKSMSHTPRRLIVTQIYLWNLLPTFPVAEVSLCRNIHPYPYLHASPFNAVVGGAKSQPAELRNPARSASKQVAVVSVDKTFQPLPRAGGRTPCSFLGLVRVLRGQCSSTFYATISWNSCVPYLSLGDREPEGGS